MYTSYCFSSLSFFDMGKLASPRKWGSRFQAQCVRVGGLKFRDLSPATGTSKHGSVRLRLFQRGRVKYDVQKETNFPLTRG